MTAVRTIRCVMALSGLLLLGACITPGGSDAPTLETARSSDPTTQTTAGLYPMPPGPKPDVPADFPVTSQRPGVFANQAPAPLPPRRPAFPRVQPDALDGMALERALSLFGKPSEVRRGPLVTTWSYAGAHCRLEIDFHFSVVDNAMQAHETRIVGPAAAPLCLHDLAVPNAALAER